MNSNCCPPHDPNYLAAIVFGDLIKQLCDTSLKQGEFLYHWFCNYMGVDNLLGFDRINGYETVRAWTEFLVLLRHGHIFLRDDNTVMFTEWAVKEFILPYAKE